MNNKDFENKVVKTAISLIEEKGYVCSVDTLLKLEYLTKDGYESWRSGKIGYLEKACNINLSKLSFINQTIRKFAAHSKLKPSWTSYQRHGKGVKQPLFFSKSRNRNTEDAYATHYVDGNRIEQLKMKIE